MTWYLRAKWAHDFLDEPVDLYSEVDVRGYETRKVEIYRDGHLDFADESTHTGMTMLGEVPVGDVAEISQEPGFEAVAIRPRDFEAVWQSATSRTGGTKAKPASTPFVYP